MATKITVTRRTKFGFGYSTIAVTGSDVSVPYHTGTILQVLRDIADDRTLESFRHGTQYVSSWFVSVDGEWRHVVNDGGAYDAGSNRYKIAELANDNLHPNDTRKYESDSVVITIE